MADAGFKACLKAVLDGPADLSGFGMERLAIEGKAYPVGINEFEESLRINGKGEIGYFLRRPVGDQGGGEVGLYAGKASPDEVKALIQLLLDSNLDALVPAHPEPGAMCWGLAIVANGRENRFFTGTVDPAVLIPIKKLRTELDKWEAKAMAAPVWTLAMEAAQKPSKTAAWREFVLKFSNTGKEGIWIDHPAALDGSNPGRACHLVFGDAPQIQPGITPLPMSTQKAPLRFPKDAPALLWIGAGESVEIPAAVENPGAGPFAGRIAYSTYPGVETTAGRRRFAGGVFTEDFRF
jgi:hypothetical protein